MNPKNPINLPANSDVGGPSMAAQIAKLPELPYPQIKALWRKLFGAEVPTYIRPFLERRIAYKLQEIEFRKSHPGLIERNTRKIASLIKNGKLRKRDRDYRPVYGTVLTRQYQDQEHRVVVSADGQYEYEGRAYQSLSMIAREITGSRWSGPVFFGLKDYAAKKSIQKTQQKIQKPQKTHITKGATT